MTSIRLLHERMVSSYKEQLDTNSSVYHNSAKISPSPYLKYYVTGSERRTSSNMAIMVDRMQL